MNRRFVAALLGGTLMCAGALSGPLACSGGNGGGTGGGTAGGGASVGGGGGSSVGGGTATGGGGGMATGGGEGTGGGTASVDDGGVQPPVEPIPFQVTTTSTRASIGGTVIDVVTQMPIRGASVSVNDAGRVTNDAGFFLIEVPIGKGTLSIDAPGFIQLREPVGLSPGLALLPLALMPAAPMERVEGDGGLIARGDVDIEVPPGAFPAGADVTATWLSGPQLAAASGPAAFSANDAGWVTFGQLSISASSPPQQPVVVRVPLPSGVTSVVSSRLGADLRWEPPIAPTSVQNGVATFLLPSFSDHTFAQNVPQGSWVIEASSGASSSAMTLVPLGTTVATAPGEQVVLSSTTGARVTLSESSSAKLNACSACEAFGSELEVSGRVNAATPPRIGPLPMRPRFTIRSRSAVIGVRGTALDAVARPCSSDAGVEYDISVGEGSVSLVGNQTQDLNPGQRAQGCASCPGTTCSGCTGWETLTGCFCPAGSSVVECRGPYSGIYVLRCCPR